MPFNTVFKGRDQFNRLLSLARSEDWKSLPIGQRTAAVGRALVGTRYKSFSLEIDNRVEAPSVNFNGLDCWTFFETSLAFARMLNEPEANWTPGMLLRYIELDRYRSGIRSFCYRGRLRARCISRTAWPHLLRDPRVGIVSRTRHQRLPGPEFTD